MQVRLDTPVLLIAWRRDSILQKVIDALRIVRPRQLFIACDGPNRERLGEAEKVAATRALIDTCIDWDCQVDKLYSDINLGCRRCVSSAITWFFSHVEEGIILEDDCVPHIDFFGFCSSLLDRYRNDSRIWSICGSNFQLGHRRGDASYYFSIHGDSWGWATWRRAWEHYEQTEALWPRFRDSGRLRDVFLIKQEEIFWLDIINNLFDNGKPDSWAYQWWLTSWMNHGLHIWPNSNLISNIGFGDDATHTFGATLFAGTQLQSLGPLTHPDFILPDRTADEFSFLYRRSGLQLIESSRFGKLYPWLLRLRQLKREGLTHYILNRVYGSLSRG